MVENHEILGLSAIFCLDIRKLSEVEKNMLFSNFIKSKIKSRIKAKIGGMTPYLTPTIESSNQNDCNTP